MLKIFNTLSRKKELFKPLSDKVQLFVCGPTVYDFIHIGNARTYIVFDVFARYLRHKGNKVFYLQNITDVDDKIIQKAKELGETLTTVARRFEKKYFEDIQKLGIKSVTKYARATDHIPEIISQVERLLKKGYAYKIPDDGIYYDISRFKDYGKLARRTREQAEDAVSRIDESLKKRNKGDFVLWKFSKLGEPKWESPWGWGRPGWHIEDTAITEKYFGAQYDIHGGARDLVFPHHEAEIAQMEAISGKKPLVRYWMHSGFLKVLGRKMAKSLGNFITVRDFLKEYSPRVFRFLVLKAHYRSPIDYSQKLADSSKRVLERFDEFINKLCLISDIKHGLKSDSGKEKSGFDKSCSARVEDFRKKFFEALDDDFNTPKAISVLFSLMNRVNKLLDKDKLQKSEAKKILSFLKEVDEIFGVIFWGKGPEKPAPKEILELVDKREKLRKQGKWEEADEIRDLVREKGWWIEDRKEGPWLKPLDKRR